MSVETATPRRIYLCADDYGISPSVNEAIRHLIAGARINATSVMVAAPSLHRSEAVALNLLLTRGARAAIGLHLTMTAPFRPLSKDFTPVTGGAFPSLRRMLTLSVLRRLNRAALQAEIAAQIRLFQHTFDRAPEFIDGHQHVHLFPQVSDALLAAVKEMAPNAWVRQCGRAGSLPLADRIRDRKGLLLDVLSRRFRARAATMGVRTNTAFAGTYDFDDKADFAALFPRFLRQLPDGGLVMCHPGFVDAELLSLDPLTSLRENEYAYFAAESFPKLLASHGVSLA
jgi:predicted glycoside hydrolase/deacetylase ChbG (UPF0249 family)